MDQRDRGRWGSALLSTALALGACTGGDLGTVSPRPSLSPSPVQTVSRGQFSGELYGLCFRLEANYPRFNKVRTHKQFRKKITQALKLERRFVKELRKLQAPEGYEGTYDAYVKSNERFLEIVERIVKTTKKNVKGPRGRALLLARVVKAIQSEIRYLELGLATQVPERCLFGITKRDSHADLFAARANVVCNRYYEKVGDISDRLKATTSPYTASDAYQELGSIDRNVIARLEKKMPDGLPRRARFTKAFKLYRQTTEAFSGMADALDALSQSAYDAAFEDYKATRKRAVKFADRLNLYVCNALF